MPAHPTFTRRSLLCGASLTALVSGAPRAEAGTQFRSLAQALSLQSHTAIASAAAAGGTTAAATANLGAQNLARAAANFTHFQSLAAAIAQGTGHTPPVTDGISPQGLQQASGVGTNAALWIGANTALASGADPQSPGTVDVTVTQTKPVAALTWQNFSVGAHTKLIYNQSAGGSLASTWVAINTLSDASTNPSTILGEITAPGKVYVINRNGIAFGAGSVVNVGALVAATAVIANNNCALVATCNPNLTYSQFGTDASGNLTFNLYGAQTTINGHNTYAPTFVGGALAAPVTVDAGALIETPAPTGNTAGGYVMLLGGQASNAGVITTPQGQTVLAGGTDFSLRPGYSSSGNTLSTTFGSEVGIFDASVGNTAGFAGNAINSGVIVADQGDITMVGHTVTQAGVLLATTTVNTRGTEHLLTDNSDPTASVILAPDSVTEILPEDNGQTALDTQRANNISLSGSYNIARAIGEKYALGDFSALADQHGESRVEISTGGTVDVQPGALAIAQGGQVAIAGGQQVLLETGSVLDVSGTSSAVLPAAMDALLVNIQPYQERDSAGNRNNGGLKSQNVYLDERQLQEVLTGAYAGNVYTKGGLLEVSGYLGLVPHGILEWSAIGGQVILQGQNPTLGGGTTSSPSGTVEVQPGAEINLTGGLVSYQAGAIPQSYIVSSTGQIYDINNAPGDLIYTGIYQGFVVDFPRWRVTNTYINPLLTPPTLPSPAYQVGRDAGTLTIDAATVLMQGTVAAGVSEGQFQTQGRPATVTDPYLLAQGVVAQGGALQIGNYLQGSLTAAFNSDVTFATTMPAVGGTITPPLVNTVMIDAGQFNAADFANLTVATAGTARVEAPITVADGGGVMIAAQTVLDDASITARAGRITLTNVLPGSQATNPLPGFVEVASGATLSARGVWTNAVLDPVHVAGEALANGGSIAITSTGGLTLSAGSVLDVSSGGAFLAGGKLLSATGGSVSVAADIGLPVNGVTPTYLLPVSVQSRFVGYGNAGGGTLSLTAPEVRIGGGTIGVYTEDQIVLDPGFFSTGFARYVLDGFLAAGVAADTQVQVVEPIYVQGFGAPLLPTDGDPASAYQVLLPPLYFPRTGGGDSLQQRGGASLVLEAEVDPGSNVDGGSSVGNPTLTISAGASITVDPRQSITLESYGQVTVLGTLTAHSGTINVWNTRGDIQQIGGPSNYLPGLSVWLGADSRLDVSGQAVTLTDPSGRRYGLAGNGGTISLGASPTADVLGDLGTLAEVVELPGAVLDLTGSATTVDIVPGVTTGSLTEPPAPVTLAGNGGSLLVRSYVGAALEGGFDASGAGPGAAGGFLSLSLDPDPYIAELVIPAAADGLFTQSRIVVSQHFESVLGTATLLPGQLLPSDTAGVIRISADQIAAGGFDSVTLAAPTPIASSNAYTFAAGAIAFDGAVNLSVGRSLVLDAPALGDIGNESTDIVSLSAPYVALAGRTDFAPDSGNNDALSPVITVASLAISADQIDIADTVSLGAEALIADNSLSFTNNINGFEKAAFFSRGDIRFGSGTLAAGGLASTGDFLFKAQQLYPTTGSQAEIVAGGIASTSLQKSLPVYSGTITIQGTGSIPAVPDSVAGTLAFFGREVDQAGVVRAPLGVIDLGAGDVGGFGSTNTFFQGPLGVEQVRLEPGSVTSVSLDGTTIPYGGTADGVNYFFAGTAVGTFNPTIYLQSQNTTIASGATLDISGGGTLAGSGFIFGRGGTIDVNKAPLISSASGTVLATSSDLVYAIVPGYGSAYAPISPGDAGYAPVPTGEQITIGAGEVPGLAAGTYTLLPAYYDLLPGAYRVELSSSALAPGFASAAGNYTVLAAVTVGTANTGVSASLPQAALITPAAGVAQLAQYDTETYSQFELAQAATFSQPRPNLPQDAGTLAVNLDAITGPLDAFGFPQTTSFAIAPGTLLQAPAAGGFGATVEFTSPMPIEVVPAAGDPGVPTVVVGSNGFATIVPHATLAASELDALALPRLVLGGTVDDSGGGTLTVDAYSPEVLVLPGSTLAAGDVILTATRQNNNPINAAVIVSPGATITTIGEPATAASDAEGYLFADRSLGRGGAIGGSSAVLDVSSTEQVYVPGTFTSPGGAITIDSGATLLAGGSLDFVAPAGVSVTIGEAALGAKYVDVQVAAINIGSPATLAADAALLPAGFSLTDTALQSLLSGDPAAGVPAAQQLILTATENVNILGSIVLDTGSTALVLNTPAIYGYGASTDSVTIRAQDFTWSGISTTETIANSNGALSLSATPGGQIAGSDTHTIGALTIAANQITIGYGPLSQPNDQVTLDHLLAGFGSVTLAGSSSITANNLDELAVYGTIPAAGQPGQGGALTFDTPLLTTQPGARLQVSTSGAFQLVNSSGTAANTGTVNTLGGEIDLTAQSVTLASAIALPAGRLAITADGTIANSVAGSSTTTSSNGTTVVTNTSTGTIAGAAIDILSSAVIDLAGRATPIFDQTVNTPGGTLSLESASGIVSTTTTTTTIVSGKGTAALAVSNTATSASTAANTDLTQGDDIAIAGGSKISVSAPGAAAGGITLSALGGTVDVAGSLLGTAGGGQAAGSFSLLAGSFGPNTTFDGLNSLLDTGGITGARAFELATGDILIDQTIAAHTVTVIADTGTIEVAGTINASGATPGSIALAAGQNLTLDATALLNAQATGVQHDSYGLPIDAENRAHVTLTVATGTPGATNGTLTLDPGATIDLRYGTGGGAGDGNQGVLVLNAPRTADGAGVQASVTGSVNVLGAADIYLYAFKTYLTTDPNGTIEQHSSGIAGEVTLDQISTDNTLLQNGLGALGGQLAGLITYGATFNLAPGVQIEAGDPAGKLTIQGDLDFSGLRIGDPTGYGRQVTSAYGSGEAGSVVFRASGDLVVNGSVTDGFAPPPDTSLSGSNALTGDNGWVFAISKAGARATDPLNADILLPDTTSGVLTKRNGTVYTTTAIELGKGTVFQVLRPISLNYDITIEPAAVQANTTLPFSAAITVPQNNPPPTIPAGGWVATAPIMRNGVVIFQAGQLIPGGFRFQTHDVLGAGTRLPVAITLGNNTRVPAGTPLDIFFSSSASGAHLVLSANTAVLPDNALIPSGTKAVFDGVFAGKLGVQALTGLDYRTANANGVQGYLYPLAQLLPAGSQSWSMNFTAGANTVSAAAGALLPKTILSSDGVGAANTIDAQPGSLLIDDQHYSTPSPFVPAAAPAFSVIRTGTGDLSLNAGGSIDQSSLYGIYTAGTVDPLAYSGVGTDPNQQFNQARQTYGTCSNGVCQLFPVPNKNGANTAALNALIGSTYAADYTIGGGDVSLLAQGDITSDQIGQTGALTTAYGNLSTDLVGNWLWRQGSGTLALGVSQPTAWWLNFGTYVVPLDPTGGKATNRPELVGFEGIGTLGGGNLTVVAGGNVGQQTFRDGQPNGNVPRSEALNLVVGGTGRLVPGTLTPVITGGGTLALRVGGVINPLDQLGYNTVAEVNTDGDIVDLRGMAAVSAGAVGRIDLGYGIATPNDPRPNDAFASVNGTQTGGFTAVLGDATLNVVTERDLVLGGAGDPGREPEQSLTQDGPQLTFGNTGFSLWRDDTAISLLSAGGNATPTTVPDTANILNSGSLNTPTNSSPTDYRNVYPTTLLVSAPDGNIIYSTPGTLAFSLGSTLQQQDYSLETAPSPNGEVSFLAGGSIDANGYVVDISGANPAFLSSPLNPVVITSQSSNIRVGGGTNQSPLALFALEADTPTTDLHASDTNPARFYAGAGDILNFQTGEVLNFGGNDPISTWYVAAKPVWILAGRDIVSSGVRPQLGFSGSAEENLALDGANAALLSTSGNLILNDGPAISVVSAGRDILSSYFYVGGPGLLEFDAGRNIYQAGYSVSAGTSATQVLSYGDVKSLGSLILGAPISLTGGASIAVQAGTGAGPDTTAFADLYFDPANQANLALPLTDPANTGKVQLVYAAALAAQLATDYGYTGGSDGALAFFKTLPAAVQTVIVRGYFYQELLASGRQYNDPASRFYRSYERGRTAIDTLFPSTALEQTKGVPVGYTGTITALSGTLSLSVNNNPAPTLTDAGFATLFGGSVQVLDPGGPILLGTSGSAAGANSGIVTYGSGDIDIYALGSILLGQSRIFTTAGGNILIWSSAGDINAGIGAKTSITFNPPLTVYDDVGDITITPPASSSGAGIATLQSLPDIPAGNIDLIAPLGTIDAGEAGIRVSGNLNLAAARLANTANIAVKGSTTGVPTVNVASLGAVEAAGAAAGAAQNAAQTANQKRDTSAEDAASVIEVEVVSIGGSYEEQRRKRKPGL